MPNKIFLDSGDPKETKEALSLLGILDGQTTNPSLVLKNSLAQEKLKSGEKFSAAELLNFYESQVQEISALIPNGSVSIEVYADANTSAEEMLDQAARFNKWIPNAHIKYPTTTEGLKAAEISIKEGMRVNMTLVFTQEQAAAVYAATMGAKKGDVFVSPFIGRLDDRGENGLDLIKNIVEMYKKGDGHVEVLAASVRSKNHFQQSIALGADIITAPLSAIRVWKENLEDKNIPGILKPIPYQEVDLNKSWQDYNIEHELTAKGLQKFAEDWNSLIK